MSKALVICLFLVAHCLLKRKVVLEVAEHGQTFFERHAVQAISYHKMTYLGQLVESQRFGSEGNFAECLEVDMFHEFAIGCGDGDTLLGFGLRVMVGFDYWMIVIVGFDYWMVVMVLAPLKHLEQNDFLEWKGNEQGQVSGLHNFPVSVYILMEDVNYMLQICRDFCDVSIHIYYSAVPGMHRDGW